MTELTIGDIEQLEIDSGLTIGELQSLDLENLSTRPLMAMVRIALKHQGQDMTMDEIRTIPYKEAANIFASFDWGESDPKE